MKIGVIQLSSKLDPQENLEKIRPLMQQAVAEEVEGVFLPECFYSMSDGLSVTPHLVAKGNKHYQQIQQLAVDFNLYLLSGSAITRHEDGNSIVNRNYVFSPQGEEVAHYDKIHLFQCDLKQDKTVIDEAKLYSAGSELSIFKWGGMNIGQTICFDLRFPAQFQEYRKLGVDLFTIPAAFTRPTGKAHWHTLLRARAIETQSFIVAPAQWGKHNERISTYGHSLVIDPWGEVLADAKDGEKLITAELDFNLLAKTRQAVPINII
jgi:deaminated glutathione amidase